MTLIPEELSSLFAVMLIPEQLLPHALIIPAIVTHYVRSYTITPAIMTHYLSALGNLSNNDHDTQGNPRNSDHTLRVTRAIMRSVRYPRHA